MANGIETAPPGLRRIIIVGGGTAGWLSAAMLSAQLSSRLFHIEVIESEEIGTIGVGESTIPPFVRLLQKLGIDEQDFVARTQGCYKLGIEFEGWREHKHRYFHPFGAVGRNIRDHEFYQCWLKANQEQQVPPLMAFSPCAVMAQAQRFYSTQPAGVPAMGASYALHMDATLAVAYLRRYAEGRGVVGREGKVVGAQRKDNGHIANLQLEQGQTVEGDFFFDCTGFRALLSEGELGVGYDHWAYMPCDRSVSIKTRPLAPIVPYTRATARKSGWSWKIPLRSSTGQGYVFSSRHSSDAQAKSMLLSNLGAERITDPKIVGFRPGKRREPWKHNCLAVGLSAGFLEPLESTSIHLIARGVEFFLRYFPDGNCDPALAREYNRRMGADFEEVRDFILLHYALSERRDTAFWRDCAQLEVPDSLRERIALFKARGAMRDGVDELFRATSWQAVFEGMGVRPRSYNPRLDSLSADVLTRELRNTRRAIQTLVKSAPSYEEVLLGGSLP